MRSEAYKLSGFTVVISALGFLLRWLQDMRIVSEEGLAVNASISWMVSGIVVITALGLGIYVRHLRQYDAPGEARVALKGQTPLYGMISMIPAVLLAAGGALMVIKPGDDVLWPTMHRICGGMMIVGGFGAGVVAMNAVKEGREATCRRGIWMMLAFSVFWLVTGYRDAASDPIVWRFVVGIVTQCAALLAIYHTAGYFYGVPHPKWTMFMCNFAAFLCIMSAIDGSSLTPEGMDLGRLAQSIGYVGLAAQFLIWAFVVTENLKTKPLTPVGRETPEKS